MSFLDEFVKALIKADKENQPQSQPQSQSQPQPQPQPQPKPQPEFDYKAEYEKLLAQNTNLQKQLGDAQQANLNLLNKTPVNDTHTFSDIMRGETYHPLYERSKS